MNSELVGLLIFILVLIWLWKLISKKLNKKEDDFYKTNDPKGYEAISREADKYHEINKKKIKINIQTENPSNTCPRCKGTGFNGGCDKCGGKGWLDEDHLP